MIFLFNGEQILAYFLLLFLKRFGLGAAFLDFFRSLPYSTLMSLFLACLAFIPMKRSKSVNSALLSLAAIFLAHVVSCHFLVISAFSQALRTVPEREDCPILIVNGVKCKALKLISLRRTPLQGPSTKALFWSMTSTITASFPFSGPCKPHGQFQPYVRRPF